MDTITFNRRKAEMAKKYSELYDEMKRNGAPFSERESVAIKLQLLQEMKKPAEIPPFDKVGLKKLYITVAQMLAFFHPEARDRVAEIYKKTTHLLLEAKKYYEAQGKKVGGDVALNERMRKLYQKVGYPEYA